MKNNAPLCACNCGGKVKWNESKKCWNKYIHGHNNKGKIRSSEHCKNISESKIGENNPAWKDKIIVYCANCEKPLKKLLSKIKHNKNVFCGRKCNGEWASKNLSGKNSPCFKRKRKPFSSEHCKKISERKKGKRLKGECFHWKGGISDNKKMKEIAKKINRTIKETKQLYRQLYSSNLTQIIKENSNENNQSIF